MADIADLMNALASTTGKIVTLAVDDDQGWIAQVGLPGVRPEVATDGATALEALTALAVRLDGDARAEMARAENAFQTHAERHEQLAAVLDQGEVATDA